MKAKKYTPNGFTLIEMLVVIALVVLLASLIFPAIDGALRKARETQCVSNLRAQGIAWNSNYLSAIASPRDSEMDTVFPWLSAMYPDNGLPNLRQFVCPSDRSRGKHGSKPQEDPDYASHISRYGGYDPNDFPETDDNLNNPPAGDHAKRNGEVLFNSYMYEFSDATISWDWQGYVLNSNGGFVTPEEIDLVPDGRITWGEVKLAQLSYGDTASMQGYDRTMFPLVRCFHHYKDKSIRIRNLDNPGSPFLQRTFRVLNLAVAGNIFLSGPQWEYPLAP